MSSSVNVVKADSKDEWLMMNRLVKFRGGGCYSITIEQPYLATTKLELVMAETLGEHAFEN